MSRFTTTATEELRRRLIRGLGSDGFIVQADVCKPQEIRRTFQQVRSEFGSLDIFVSNARTEAPTFYEGPMEITLDKWDTAGDSQAKAFLVAVQEAAPLMSKGGRIVAITFAPGGRFGSWQPWVAMGAAKAAMEVLVRDRPAGHSDKTDLSSVRHRRPHFRQCCACRRAQPLVVLSHARS